MTYTAYTKVTVEGHTLNARTAALYKQVKRIYPLVGGSGTIRLVQGSFTNDVSASAGTHSGGGVGDWMVEPGTDHNYNRLQKAFRYAQVAAWHRTTAQGFSGDHVHGVVVGDDSAATLAKAQVVDYKNHKTGLKGHAADNSWHPSKIFEPSYPLYDVSLGAMIRESKKLWVWRTNVGTKSVQQALNLKLGLSLKVDGKFGKATKTAYKKWQYQVDKDLHVTTTHNGIPTNRTLTLLGAGRFDVVK